MTDWFSLSRIVVATLGGLAIGVERERSGHATGSHARFAGVRTFTLIGGLGGLAGWLAACGLVALATVIAAGAAGLTIVAYLAASRHDVDGTTEVAALVVLAAGVLAGVGEVAVASGVVAICALLLVEKSRVHALVGRIDDEELRAAARFGVMAIVILPLLPPGPFGPLGGVRPRELWTLVLFFTGLSFAGYLARRVVGSSHGYPVAGLLGGIVSSTSVTLTFARLSRTDRAAGGALGLGAVGACTVLVPRVLIATAVLNRDVAAVLVWYLAAPFLVGLIALMAGIRRSRDGVSPSSGPDNPLQIGPALQMAATFQVVLAGVTLARSWFGTVGLLASGAVLGLTDVDALTLSMSRHAATGVTPALAAGAIATGILANGLLKLGVALTIGTPSFRRACAPALVAMPLATALGLWLLR